jgi:hypothetical protein
MFLTKIRRCVLKKITVFVEDWNQDKRRGSQYKPRDPGLILNGFQIVYLSAGMLVAAMLILGPFVS